MKRCAKKKSGNLDKASFDKNGPQYNGVEKATEWGERGGVRVYSCLPWP